MANQLKMAKVQTILTLHQQGWSQRRISDELGIDRTLSGHTLTRAPLRLEPGTGYGTRSIGVSGRIGISKGVERPLRFYVRGHPAVSGHPR